MTISNSNRITELKAKRDEYEAKIADCRTWLTEKSGDHPDRQKVHNDKGYYECQINCIDKKIYNLSVNMPENGVSSEVEQNNLNRETINKTTS